MWWECRVCSSGGNNERSLEQHRKDKPDHVTHAEFESFDGADR